MKILFPYGFISCCVLSALISNIALATAGNSTPFYSRNQNPFVQIYGIPAVESAAITPPGKLEARLIMNIANNLSLSSTPREQIILDGESYRTTCVLRYGLPRRIELGIDIPFISHSRGVFDHFIEDWHDFFNLPQGNRLTREKRILHYQYVKDGKILSDTNKSSEGLGDILLSGGMALLS
ncbi:DUF3187 family protein, partial [Thermodesulfobacteriota bacterium]